MNRTKHFTYNCSISGHSLSLYKVKLELDFKRLYSWMHEEHVAKFWQLNKSYDHLYKHFEEQLNNPNQELFMLSINGNLVAYGEVYNACSDRIAEFYSCLTGDYGIHLLIGDTKSIGQGYSSLIIRGLSDYLFSQYNASRVLVEPSSAVKQLTSLERRLGFSNLGSINLPEKIATLYIANRYEFYTANPAEISCEVSSWPIVYLRFPSYPTDKAVTHWISQLNSLIASLDPYIVISSFDLNYQFSQNARKEEMAWFKNNKKHLEKFCLGMLRVTTDLDMITKLNSPAMKKGMPFKCIPCPSLEVAQQMADIILRENIA